VGGPVDGIDYGIVPRVTDLHGLEESRTVSGFSYFRLKVTVDSTAPDIEGDRAGRRQGDKGAMGTKLLPVCSCVEIGLHVELGEKTEMLLWNSVVLVTLLVLQRDGKRRGGQGAYDGLDDIPVGVEGRVWDGILDLLLRSHTGNEAGVVRGEDAIERLGTGSPFWQTGEKANHAKHALSFGSEGTWVVTVDWAGSVCETCAVEEAESPSISALLENRGAITTRAKGGGFEKGHEFEGRIIEGDSRE
jgi:hypothetical protein